MLLALRAAKIEASLNDDEIFSEIGARWTIRATRAHASGPMSRVRRDSPRQTGLLPVTYRASTSGSCIGRRHRAHVGRWYATNGTVRTRSDPSNRRRVLPFDANTCIELSLAKSPLTR